MYKELTNKPELKPCPFCGGRADMVRGDHTSGHPRWYKAYCTTCQNRTWEPGQCNTYGNWIETNYPTKESCINKCSKAVRDMTNYFNELTAQVGYANGIYHCWCKDAKGRIIDPTKKQFNGSVNYTLIAGRFLEKHEIEPSTGAIFLDPQPGGNE